MSVTIQISTETEKKISEMPKDILTSFRTNSTLNHIFKYLARLLSLKIQDAYNIALYEFLEKRKDLLAKLNIDLDKIITTNKNNKINTNNTTNTINTTNTKNTEKAIFLQEAKRILNGAKVSQTHVVDVIKKLEKWKRDPIVKAIIKQLQTTIGLYIPSKSNNEVGHRPNSNT
ncbi:MAG: hypothetical protein ACP6IU_13075 [Candidatus Asgardarchaeia archaeon]